MKRIVSQAKLVTIVVVVFWKMTGKKKSQNRISSHRVSDRRLKKVGTNNLI